MLPKSLTLLVIHRISRTLAGVSGTSLRAFPEVRGGTSPGAICIVPIDLVVFTRLFAAIGKRGVVAAEYVLAASHGLVFRLLAVAHDRLDARVVVGVDENHR